MIQVVTDVVAAVVAKSGFRNTTGNAFATAVTMMLDMSCTLVTTTTMMMMMTATTGLQMGVVQLSRNEANIRL